ncbi:glycosyltransferase [Candidatus Pelagibacter sp.]|nr:glycosyltransferase [Candidatus Pelagibacter sp.]
MAKDNLFKKTKLKKVLVCILYHNIDVNLSSLINKIEINKNHSILIIVDGKKKIKNKKEILSLNNNIKFIYSLKKKTVAFNRNLGLNYAKKNFELILYLDSDVIPEKKIIKSHLKFHNKYENFPLLGGAVIPSFFKNKFNIWEILDGCLSWFTSIDTNYNKIVNKPYHLPTCNLSIKIDFIIKNKIFFDKNLKTGEDVDLCNKIREKKGKIMLIKNARVLHQDRKSFKDFFNHHASWGRHQFYTLYKKKYSNLIGKNNFNFIFLIIYPFLMPFINLISTFLTIFPWIKFKLRFIIFIIPTYVVHLMKGFFTYLEFIKK